MESDFIDIRSISDSVKEIELNDLIYPFNGESIRIRNYNLLSDRTGTVRDNLIGPNVSEIIYE